MSIITNIKTKLGNLFLGKEKDAVQRTPMFINLSDARTVGILFEAGSQEDFELVKRYVLYLREMRKKVKVIGYYNSKEVPQMTYSKLEYDFFAQKQLNWHMKPMDVSVSNFINEEYDILIDLNINDHFPLKYIAALSKAKCKVGRAYPGSEKLYDLAIEQEEGKSLKHFLRQVDTYLLMINKRAEDAA